MAVPNNATANSATRCDHCTANAQSTRAAQHACRRCAPPAGGNALEAPTVADVDHAHDPAPNGNTGANSAERTDHCTANEEPTALPIRWHVFTDGAGISDEERESPHAGRLVAGYGVAELEALGDRNENVIGPRARTYPQSVNASPAIPLGQLTDQGTEGGLGATACIRWAIAGEVVTTEDATKHGAPDDIGAAAHTNNAGELSALYYAIERALTRPPRRGCERIHTDSLYAMHMATGHWMPRRKGKRNAPLITTIRHMWRRLQRRRPGEVELRHVRSHIAVPGNELADWLAEQGKRTQRADMLQPAIQHMRTWLRQRGITTNAEARSSARPPGAGDPGGSGGGGT